MSADRGHRSSVVRDLAGNLLHDQIVWHVYRIEGGLVQSMGIRTEP
ncbi:hypothetical protein J8F10_10900 [Gemmata sp. G18]|uniref:Uncharacterized protein n=1 Tax=Gemmata palustris TaxID=2822762 RepID=A0ABS5BPY4_9BACT|nr:hypothetical protein [Gemmata palustris]MBP3955791.1 hypothetical protein [Gemmata palustris]